MINYTIFNQSTVVNSTNLQNMVKAINMLLVNVCSDWGFAPTQLVIGTGNTHPNNSIYMMDNTDVDGALGYHDEISGKAYAKIFAKTIINYGGAILYKDNYTFTVAQCLFHELLEMMGNNVANKWYLDNSGIFWAGELCDPVESNLIVYTLPGNIKVGLSDYVLPSWFSPDSTTRPFNKLNTLTAPFTLAPGGYAILIDNYQVIDIYGMNNGSHVVGTYSTSFTLLAATQKDRENDISNIKLAIKKRG